MPGLALPSVPGATWAVPSSPGCPQLGEGSLARGRVPSCAFLQKITTKNAFGLHLIDYMTEILNQKNSELTNFQVRGVPAAAALFLSCPFLAQTWGI